MLYPLHDSPKMLIISQGWVSPEPGARSSVCYRDQTTWTVLYCLWVCISAKPQSAEPALSPSFLISRAVSTNSIQRTAPNNRPTIMISKNGPRSEYPFCGRNAIVIGGHEELYTDKSLERAGRFTTVLYSSFLKQLSSTPNPITFVETYCFVFCVFRNFIVYKIQNFV